MIRFLLVFLVVIAPVLADERILAFDSQVVVKKNGDLEVKETIRVRSEGVEIKRGIYRDIPRLQHTKWGLKKKKPFKVLEVKRDGVDERFAVEKIGKGGMRIRIGKKEKILARGVYTYEITYVTGRQLHFEEKRDALYWNVNGTEWGFPIDKVSARVVLPPGVAAGKAWGFTGKHGGKGKDYKAVTDGNVVLFETTRVFRKKENLSIVVEWPPGLLDKEAYAQADASLLKEHPGVILAGALFAGALFYSLVAWLLVGRDPKKGVIVPRFEPPEGFSPGAVRYLNRMRFDNTCFSAAVMGLAVKGVASITQDGKSYTLKNEFNENQKEPLDPDELRLYNKLLGSSREVELKQANHTRIGGARKALQKMLSSKLEKTHFMRNLKWWFPGLLGFVLAALVLVFATGASPVALFLLGWLSIWSMGTTALLSQCINLWRNRGFGAAFGMTLFALPFVGGWLFGAGALWVAAGPWPAVAFVLAAVLNVIFYHLIKAPTHLGRAVMDQIDGFRNYLEVAEEQRLNYLNPPEKTPELFEKFLPYALALDCEQEWSKQFDGILAAAGAAPGDSGSAAYQPSFYTGSYTGMDSVMAAAAVGGAITGALASSSSAPSSSSSGGGGFSGGGGGGGGGGGW